LRQVISISKLNIHFFIRFHLLGVVAVGFKATPAFDWQLILLSNSSNECLCSALLHLRLRDLRQCIHLLIFTQRGSLLRFGLALIFLLLFLVIIVDGGFQVAISPLQKFADLLVLQAAVLDDGSEESDGLVHKII
jgi:hypothetical protein